ncbi:hypothetical protein ABMA28_010306 [Loxostege sticticalis]|uniref:Uncharacterized protein n=1 Tax=Loxostege sticticalis TaxID=481309 RepID=A0ABD0SAE2_LOXSC
MTENVYTDCLLMTRYLGLPVMLKAGEYSPNNPLLARERAPGDALLGLGEYERRRHTLRRLRQQQYREYLDQQAKKKQEAKEQAERERREREEKEREREEREREREREERERERQERERRIRVERTPERRRASENYSGNVGTFSYSNKVDTGVQVDSVTAPLSVAVQTDDIDLFRLPSPCKGQLTQAERELSPHTVVDPSDRPIQPAAWAADQGRWGDKAERRRSYGDFDERSSTLVKKTNREKLTSDLRHSYMPSIFDADAIQMRNLQAEKEAAARRQFYQQELKNQIMEQQRIREERKTREKMLEQAEMRRLEEQLRLLRAAQDREVDKHQHLDEKIKEDHIEYDKRRKQFQQDIENENLKLVRAPLASQLTSLPKRLPTSRSDTDKLPNYYFNYPREIEREIRPLEKPEIHQERYRERNETQERNRFQDEKVSRFSDKIEQERKPYSTNIPDDSIFSPNYDVDSYLRKNLNFKDRYDFNRDFDYDGISKDGNEKNVEKVLVHERPKPKNVEKIKPVAKERKILPQESIDSLPIPVLRHSPLSQGDRVESSSNLSDAMKKVDDKWKVPAVQKNILKNIPNEEGKNVSILTQLGSIRRQLQLEQLKLDGISKADDEE